MSDVHFKCCGVNGEVKQDLENTDCPIWKQFQVFIFVGANFK